MELGIVAAVDINGLIGNKGRLPWPLIKEDMARMHEIIDGHSIIVGRKTREELPNNWDVNYFAVSTELALQNRGERTFEEAVRAAQQRHPTSNIYALGGTNIFKEAFRFATKLYLTRITKEYTGDTYFPRIPSYWSRTSKVVSSEFLIFEEYENTFATLPVPKAIY